MDNRRLIHLRVTRGRLQMSVCLKLAQPFGPFTQMEHVELPDFAILTGLNGSGKTQLLQAIVGGHVEALISDVRVDPNQILYVGPQLVPKLQLEYSVSNALKEE